MRLACVYSITFIKANDKLSPAGKEFEGTAVSRALENIVPVNVEWSELSGKWRGRIVL